MLQITSAHTKTTSTDAKINPHKSAAHVVITYIIKTFSRRTDTHHSYPHRHHARAAEPNRPTNPTQIQLAAGQPEYDEKKDRDIVREKKRERANELGRGHGYQPEHVCDFTHLFFIQKIISVHFISDAALFRFVYVHHPHTDTYIYVRVRVHM